ncbi:uncharacterized protein LOC115627866 isoform X2 [Scaptodrosophila lebanonensis]|uniref:Uncharacterized protein LOC115627866 isoform X2 n=1 Tax=Drosophila lebanonensis TaxID=7225 RepID=A0A6J2TWQ3_DROLE|nr:uncharacterized protein LOC115627866 isoform X2 [Scaptodrosophila lebanonensis]
MMNSNNPAVASRFAVMCRACMRCDSPTEPLQLHSIHAYVRVNNVTDTYTVVQLIESLAPTLQVKSDDGLPQRICPDCLTRLLDLRQFRQMCLKSDRRMRTLESETVMMPTNLIEAIAQKTEDVLQTELVEDLGALIEYDDELRVKAEYGTIINTVAREEPDTDVDVEGTEMLEFSANDLFVYEPKNEEQCFDHSYIEVEAQVTLYKDYSDIENSDELEVYELNTAECNQKKQTPNRIPNKKFIDITRQYQLHDESRPFQCSQCNYRFASLVSLKRHETKCLCGHFISNSREKCDLLLPNAEALFTHKPVYHSKQDLECNPIKFSCDDCEKTFENPALLTSHRRFHGTKKLIMPAVATSDKTQLYECQFCKQRSHTHTYARAVNSLS